MESKPTLHRSGSRRVTSTKLTVLGGEALVLRIELRDSVPLLHRTILVPANITLRKLHVTLLWAMGWQGGHLHEFIINGTNYVDRKSTSLHSSHYCASTLPPS